MRDIGRVLPIQIAPSKERMFDTLQYTVGKIGDRVSIALPSAVCAAMRARYGPPSAIFGAIPEHLRVRTSLMNRFFASRS